MISSLTIRPLVAEHVDALNGVLVRAYGQSFIGRLRRYLVSARVATFVAELDGVPVGMVVGNDYGSIAYVAQMAVEPSLQRRGIATALMEELIAWADAIGFAALELDATPSGAPLYARFGFIEVGQTQVFTGVLPGGERGAARPYVTADRETLLTADARAFGADRSEMLCLLLDSVQTTALVTGPVGRVEGYAFAQRDVETLGPIVAPNPAAAAALIDAARTALPVVHRLNANAANEAVAAILAERKYQLVRSLSHMVRGTRPAAQRSMIYGRANLGQG